MNKLTTLIGILFITACVGYPQQPDDDYYDVVDDETVSEEPPKKPPPVFLSESRTISVREKDDVEMSCKTAEPTEHILIFEKDEKLIYAGSMKVDINTRIVYKDSVFILPTVSRSDAGTYVCSYQTQPKILAYELDVQYPPSVIAKGPAEQRVQIGDSVTVGCQARGNPVPVITWTKESGHIPSGAVKEKGLFITMENVNRHKEGTYICTASNGIGTPVSASMKLMVEYPPEISTEKAIVRTGKGDKVELICIVHARPTAQVEWSKNGESLVLDEDVSEFERGHRHAITISPVTEDHFGTYTCSASNEKGTNQSSINLTDLPKQPSFTSAATSAEETSYTLAWETESYYPIEQYTLKYRQAKANESTDLPGEWVEKNVEINKDNLTTEGLLHSMKHTIDNLFPATDYQAFVKVKNEYKWGDNGEYNFSTRRAPPPTIATSTTTTTTTTPLPLAEEKVQHPTETVSTQTSSNSEIAILSFILGCLPVILALIS